MNRPYHCVLQQVLQACDGDGAVARVLPLHRLLDLLHPLLRLLDVSEELGERERGGVGESK